MSTIRIAVIGDIPAMLALGESFLAESPYGETVKAAPADLATALDALLLSGVVFVAEQDGVLTGVIAGIVTNPWFSSKVKIATEVGWFVAKDKRGGMTATRLLKAFEQWAEASGADSIGFGDLDGPYAKRLEKFYAVRGYRLTERQYYKSIRRMSECPC